MSAQASKYGRQFIDTNVLVYAHDRSAGEKWKHARRLLEELWETGHGCLSVQVLQEFYVTVTCKVPEPIESPAAAQIIGQLSNWTIHIPNVQDMLDAIYIQQRLQISFWDAMILHSAVRLKCDILWSENFSPRQEHAGVLILNPFLPPP